MPHRIDRPLLTREDHAFLAVARHHHFGEAAAELGLSAGVVSRRIARLERLLGCSLFERTTRRVRLTEAGVTRAEALREFDLPATIELGAE